MAHGPMAHGTPLHSQALVLAPKVRSEPAAAPILVPLDSWIVAQGSLMMGVHDFSLGALRLMLRGPLLGIVHPIKFWHSSHIRYTWTTQMQGVRK